MRASIVFAAVVLPVLSLAQDSDAIAFLDSLPECAAVTVRVEAAKTSCGYDIACLCKDSSFIATVLSGTTCIPPVVVEFGNLVAEECSSKGVTIDVPGGDGADNGSEDTGGNSGSEDTSGGSSDAGDSDADDKPNWGERAMMVNVGMMLGAAGLVGVAGV